MSELERETDDELPDDLIDQIAGVLRTPVPVDASVDRAVMARVRRPRAARDADELWRWLRRPRVVHVSPLAGLALAAGLAGILVLARSTREAPDSAPAASLRTAPVIAGATRPVEFRFMAPVATSVSLVGDFNDWQPDAAPLRRSDPAGVWTISVPLAPGRYEYTFVVDGTEWVAAPGASRALEDDFGHANSVITVGEAAT